MKIVLRAVILLHIFVGVGALAGGTAAVLNPRNPMGMSAEYLVNSPFRTFLIPGLFLFVGIGIGSIFAAIALIYRVKYSAYISVFFSFVLAAWIVIQCWMLHSINILHVFYFIFGIFGIIAMCILLYRNNFQSRQI